MAKGQISFFIIIGLVILIAAGFIFYLVSRSAEIEPSVTGLDSGTIQSFVDSCLEQTLFDSIITVSMQGGYNQTPEDSYRYTGLYVPYYHIIDGGDISPTIEQVGLGISRNVETNIFECLDDFSKFTQQGYSISVGDIIVSTTVNESHVFSDVRLPLDIVLGEEKGNLESFNAQVDLPTGKLYRISQEYIAYQKLKPNFVRMTPLVDICADNNITFDTLYDGDNVVFVLVDENYNISENVSYIYNFAVKYDWEDLKVET